MHNIINSVPFRLSGLRIVEYDRNVWQPARGLLHGYLAIYWKYAINKIKNSGGNNYGIVRVKPEAFNAAGSLKSGTGRHAINDARKGMLTGGDGLPETAGGNTDLCLAPASSGFGYYYVLL